MSDADRTRWRATQLTGEATLTQPPPDAQARVLAGLMHRIDAGEVAPLDSAPAASTGAASSALWLKGALVLGLAAGGGVLWFVAADPPPASPTVATTAVEPHHPQSSTPSPTAERVAGAPASLTRETTPADRAQPTAPPVRRVLPALRPARRVSQEKVRKTRQPPAPESVLPEVEQARVVEPATPSSVAPPPPEPAPFADAKARLKAEWQVLADARAALRDRRLNAASQALRAYRTRFTNGRLDEEYWLLRIRVLLARQQPAAAREAARTYRRRHPAGAMRGLVEQLFKASKK